MFARDFFDTLINLIFVVRIYLTFSLIHILLTLQNNTGMIDGNVHKVFKMCSAVSWLGCTLL